MMMRDDLHPEELLARAAAGTLGEHEAADLKAHLARCPACALQLDLGGELARAFAPTDADYEIGARAMQRVLARPDAFTRPLTSIRTARRSGPWLAARAALIVLMLVGTGVGAAALVYRVREGRFWGAAAPATTGTPSNAVAARGARRARVRVAVGEPAAPLEPLGEPAPSAALVAPGEGAPPAVGALPGAAVPPVAGALPGAAVPPVAGTLPGAAVPPPATTPVPASSSALAPPPALAPPLPLAAPRVRRPRAGVVESTNELPAEPPATARAPAATTGYARVIFQAAESARRRGDAAEADRLYARLAAEFPGAREEIVSRALRGQLLLDELGRAAEALVSFEGYLGEEPRGALAEEARAGRAEALGRLARHEEEAAAWNDLLAWHPRSLYAPRARKRLAALADARE